MVMNLDDLPSNGNKSKADFGIPEEGTVAARVVQIIDLGVQERLQWADEDPKPPCRQFCFTFEIPADRVEIDGESKPRWFWLNHVNVIKGAERGKLYDIIRACCGSSFDGDLSSLIGKALMISIEHREIQSGKNRGKVTAKITNFAGVPKGFDVPELENETLIFDFDSPTEETWDKLPDWMKERVKEAVNFEGSAMDHFIGGGGSACNKPTDDDLGDFDDDIPF